MTSTLRRRKCEANRLAAGLCIRCGSEPRDPGVSFGKSCRQINRRKMKSRRRLFDRYRLCQRCGAQRDSVRHKYCAECRASDC